MMARDGNGCSLALEKVSVEDMAKDTEIENDKIKEILIEMTNITLIDKERYKNDKVIYIPQFLNYYDDYQKRVRRVFGETPNKVAKSRGEYRRIEESILDIWNKTTLPKILSFTPERKSRLLQRIKNKDFVSNYQQAIEKLGQSKFCLGDNDRNWKATIDWFLNNDNNYIKALEDRYEDRKDEVEDIKDAIKRHP